MNQPGDTAAAFIGIGTSLVLAGFLLMALVARADAATVYTRAQDWIGSDGRVMGCRRQGAYFACDVADNRQIYYLDCTNDGCVQSAPSGTFRRSL